MAVGDVVFEATRLYVSKADTEWTSGPQPAGYQSTTLHEYLLGYDFQSGGSEVTTPAKIDGGHQVSFNGALEIHLQDTRSANGQKSLLDPTKRYKLTVTEV